MLFRLKERCGPHFMNGVTYKSGDTVETSLDLVAMFPSKFERNYEAEKRAEAKTGKKTKKSKPDIPEGTGKGKEDDNKDDDDNVTAESEYGEDITAEYPTAEKVQVKVYVKDNWCTVVDDADGEVLNEKKLRKKEVEEFIGQYLDDDDDKDDTTDDAE